MGGNIFYILFISSAVKGVLTFRVGETIGSPVVFVSVCVSVIIINNMKLLRNYDSYLTGILTHKRQV